jgi:hypothetical protein
MMRGLRRLGILAGVGSLLLGSLACNYSTIAIRLSPEVLKYLTVATPAAATAVTSAPVDNQASPTIEAPKIEDYTKRMMEGDQLFFENGFSVEQFQAYINMGSELKKKFFELDALADGHKLYQLRLTPESIGALWNLISGLDNSQQRALLDSPISPLEMAAAESYLISLSDDLSSYSSAFAADVLDENLGLELRLHLNNFDAGSKTNIMTEGRYANNPGLMGMSVNDRVDSIKPESLDVGQIRQRIAEAAGAEDGPAVFYVISHTHLKEHKLAVNDYRHLATLEDIFTKEVLEKLGSRPAIFVLSACLKQDMISGFRDYLDKSGVGYAILTSYRDDETLLDIDDIASSLEIASQLSPDSRHPYVRSQRAGSTASIWILWIIRPI